VFSLFFSGDEVSVDREIVFMAVEMWLLWLQPWLFSSSSSSEQNINLLSHWNYYICSHYHYYSTLFIYFIRMISKMNLSLISDVNLSTSSSSNSNNSKNSSFSFDLADDNVRNLYLLGRVLKVFQQANLCKILEELNHSYLFFYNKFLSDDAGNSNSFTFSRPMLLRRRSSTAYPSYSNLTTVIADGVDVDTTLLQNLLMKEHVSLLFLIYCFFYHDFISVCCFFSILNSFLIVTSTILKTSA
jgi:hypothetical protein